MTTRPPPQAWLGAAVATSNNTARRETVADRVNVLITVLSTLDDSTDTGGSPGTDDRPCTRAGQGSRQRAGAARRPRAARRPEPEQVRKHILTRPARRPGASRQPNVPIDLDVPWRPPTQLDGSGA